MYRKRMRQTNRSNRIPKKADVPHQKIVVGPLQEIHGEKNRCRQGAMRDDNWTSGGIWHSMRRDALGLLVPYEVRVTAFQCFKVF